MKITHSCTLCGLLLAGALLPATSSFGQYNQNLTSLLAPGPNVIEKSATPLTLATFKEAVAVAWTNSSGGVLNFPTTIAASTTVFRGHYHTNAYGTNGSRFQITSSVSMQNVTAGTFTPASVTICTTSSANQSDYTLTLGLFDNVSGLPLPDEVIKQIGFVILSRTDVNYPLDVRATVTFSDSSTQAVTALIGAGAGADDTFFGFTAPPDLAISSVRFQSFAPSTENPVATRIGWDDFGVITGPSSTVPLPIIVNLSPAAYAITNASQGIHFNALTYVSIDPTNVSLVLNSTDVSGSLVFTGSPTNYSVAYTGLLPDQEYNLTISVTNSGGTATLSRTFYTATAPFVLFDAESFTDDTLYPLGALQPVTHGRGTWVPNGLEPAEIVDVGGAQAKVLKRLCTGASRADLLTFPPVSSGIITLEFDAKVSTTSGRTIDINIQPVNSGTMGSFLAWGEVSGKLAYFDNVNWLPIADLEADWHHVKIINYLSGLAAGKYDVVVNGSPVGQKLSWRNAPVGAAFGQFRIQSQNTAVLFGDGQIDNLVISAAPEDPNVYPPPQINNLNVANQGIIKASDGVRFDVASGLPVDATNVAVLLDSIDVSSGLVVTGPATNLSVAYNPVSLGNHTLEIQASNAAGPTVFAPRAFIATDEAWLFDPSDGWTNGWQWNSGQAELRTADPIDGASPYIRHDMLGSIRNFMRQYQSGTNVDITKPHYIRWKFRLNDANFAANFNDFNDRVHFFSHPVSRLGGSTTTGNGWAILATGAAHATGVGAGQTFWLYDNTDGTGDFTLQNHIDSGVLLVPDHIYAFEVQVVPASRTYSVAIVDQTSSAAFTSSTPLRFRDTNLEATHTFLHFGLQVTPTTDPRAFDMDSVFIAPAAGPVTLFNPNRSGANFSFSFESQNGINHISQFSGDLTASAWTSLVTNLGNGAVMTVTHTNVPAGPLYYRVKSQMP